MKTVYTQTRKDGRGNDITVTVEADDSKCVGKLNGDVISTKVFGIHANKKLLIANMRKRMRGKSRYLRRQIRLAAQG